VDIVSQGKKFRNEVFFLKKRNLIASQMVARSSRSWIAKAWQPDCCLSAAIRLYAGIRGVYF
jgi:hypothetical protein